MLNERSKKMKNIYEAPEVELIGMAADDIIRTSLTDSGDNDFDLGGFDQNHG
jgi:hypothetical protein